MNSRWQFDDPPDTASLTTCFVLDGEPVRRVYHDFDGGWQFHGAPDDPVTEEVARVVALDSMISGDPTLKELYDLPYGWCAFRESRDSSWIRKKNHPFATYAEDGYYLEDAVWMSEHRDDLQVIPDEIRENLGVGTYVKLLFRFAAEDADRRDGQTERMWVLITAVDEDECYIGTLENDPHHSEPLTCGDTITFHPLHIAELLDDEES